MRDAERAAKARSDMQRALAAAEEYAALRSRGGMRDHGELRQLRLKIASLVGTWIDGRWILPEEVEAAMAREAPRDADYS